MCERDRTLILVFLAIAMWVCVGHEIMMFVHTDSYLIVQNRTDSLQKQQQSNKTCSIIDTLNILRTAKIN